MGILRSFSFVVLEFTEEWVKLAFFKSKGKLPRVSIGKKNIEKQKDEQVEKAVKDLFAEFRISRRLPVFVIIPRRLVTIRNLKLPSVSRDELSEMARLQAAKQLPYPPNELISDYRVIKKTPDGYSHLALAIAHRNVIERYLTILDNARVSPEQITVSSEALIEWFMATKAASKKSPGPTAIIDIDSSFAEVAITEGGGLQLSRSFSYHAPNNWKEKLQDEIKKTFFAYEKDTSRSISSAIVTGIEESGLWLNQALLKDFKIKDSEYVHPLRITSADYKQGLSRHM
ncbi:MAG: pilus assembly protein PilM, partial [Candidatus Omnitrophota bacterium]